MGSLFVPTPGSTTATWIVPLGKYLDADARTKAPMVTLNFSTEWVISIILAIGLMVEITAFISATYGSFNPKSESSVISGVITLCAP